MTDTFAFETATKAGAKARLALAGPTGSGKTYTTLTIATPWGGTIGVIVTMRVRTEYVMNEDERGRKVPQRVGLQPVQRQGIEYEFDIIGDMDQENTLVITKTRCPDLAGLVVNRPGAELAATILNWLD